MDVVIDYSIEQIAAITSGKIIQHNSFEKISHLLLDSRKLIFPEVTIFFALKNSHKNGASYIPELYKKTVQNFVIDDGEFDIENFPSANFILVDDVLKALQLLASRHRSKFSSGNISVIGITGSNGKTIVKEWLYHLLENEYNIVRSPKSYNSQIGVPLSVLQITKQNTLAIFEAGISGVDEMGKLEKIIQPTIGVFTNIGEAHNEGFENNLQKIREKLKLFLHSTLLIFCSDDNELSREAEELKLQNHKISFLKWGRKNDPDLKIISVEKDKTSTVVKAGYSNQDIQITIPFIDDASIENAINCWCILLHFNISQKNIAEKIMQLRPVEMRLQMKEGINNCSIINDSYSADINSLRIALDFLQQQKQHQKQTVILSDILQSGKNEKELYGEVASLLHQKKIKKFIGIGNMISLQKEQFNFLEEAFFFNSVNEFKTHFSSLHFRDETILIKGARVFQFEEIDALLEKKIHQTVLSINLTSVAHNLKEYQKLLQPGVKIMAMVKAFSYGSGSYEIANLLQFNNVDYLAVAYADEGIELRNAGITLPIMVMNAEENTYGALLKYNLEPEIFSFSMLSSFEKYLDSSGLNFFPVHIKLDTGMHRLGFEESETDLLAGHLKKNNKIKIQSVFSHLVASDEIEQKNFTNKQTDSFLKSCEVLKSALGYDFIKHIANTSGISSHKNLQLDMVRLGIGLYGIDANNMMRQKLKNVSSLTTTVAQIKHVKAGESIGYGRNNILKKDAIIATVRIGYADGYLRLLSNGVGKMFLKNSFVPVAGNVCMDMTMLDITGLKNISEGDEVLVFGKHLPIQTLAKWCNTIPYEIMTGVSQRVNRVYFEE